jgi:hypothetical protein
LKADCSELDIVLFCHAEELLRFLKAPTKGPLDKDILASFEGRKNRLVMTIYSRSTNNKVNVFIVGNT